MRRNDFNQFIHRVRDEFAIHAPQYDERAPHIADDAPLTRFVADRVLRAGRVLEFGIGTGRLAIPLSRNGFQITGIDLSGDMLARLAGQPESQRMTLVEGTFTEPHDLGTFDAVICIYNTLYHTHTQEAQQAALCRAAEYLNPNGLVLLENTAASWLVRAYGRDDSRLSVREVGAVSAELTAGTISLHEQILRNIHMSVSDGQISTRPVTMRYLWPAELHLLADRAGLVVAEEYSDWNEAEFTSTSDNHIVVLRKSGATK
ncbi:class I SAM-dependent methyltransferase [Kibdelosporangium philippinense]|uniref:class I SAM-dependent methyltransferase n=1 Tax=Kibdelosporangium philippinense TaxID=211113 RepID=UPI003612E2FB